MNIKTTLVVRIINQMMLEFMVLAEHHKAISISDLGHDLAWSILNNFTKLDLVSENDLAVLKADLVSSMVHRLTAKDEQKEIIECDSLSAQIH